MATKEIFILNIGFGERTPKRRHNTFLNDLITYHRICINNKRWATTESHFIFYNNVKESSKNLALKIIAKAAKSSIGCKLFILNIIGHGSRNKDGLLELKINKNEDLSLKDIEERLIDNSNSNDCNYLFVFNNCFAGVKEINPPHSIIAQKYILVEGLLPNLLEIKKDETSRIKIESIPYSDIEFNENERLKTNQFILKLSFDPESVNFMNGGIGTFPSNIIAALSILKAHYTIIEIYRIMYSIFYLSNIQMKPFLNINHSKYIQNPNRNEKVEQLLNTSFSINNMKFNKTRNSCSGKEIKRAISRIKLYY